MERVFVVLLLLHFSSSASSRHLYNRAQPAPPIQNSTATTSSSTPQSVLRQQFENPSETLSVLLLIGGDIVQKAIAQLVGRSKLTPAAFSFGWVAYAFTALNSAFGDGTLMPLPDFPCRVINLENGNSRQNESWVVGRLLRDLELEFNGKLPKKNKKPVITVLKTTGRPARPGGDRCWWSFLFFMPLQLLIAAVPIIHPRRNWTILLITAIGSLLATLTSSLPQWIDEKFSCRKDSKNCYVITRGNGHQHIFVIQNGGLVPAINPRKEGDLSGISLNLEDLAVASPATTRLTRIATIALAVLWVFFLIVVGGLKEDAWFLLGVGGLGMVHNAYVASGRRTPEGNGVPLKRTLDGKSYDCTQIGGTKDSTMEVLQKGEELRAGLGLLLLEIFFPGNLNEEEAKYWKEKRETLSQRQAVLKTQLKAVASETVVQPQSRISWSNYLRGRGKSANHMPEQTGHSQAVAAKDTGTSVTIAAPNDLGVDLEGADAADATFGAAEHADQHHRCSIPAMTNPAEPDLSPGVLRSTSFYIPTNTI